MIATFLIGIALGVSLTLLGFVVRAHGPAWWALVVKQRPAIANYCIDMTINGQQHSFVTHGAEGRFAMKIQQRSGCKYAEPPWEVSGFASSQGELTFSVGRGKMDDCDQPIYFKRKTHRDA